VAKIWSAELNVEVIRDEDEFFALNGDSLNMLNMLFQVNRTLGVDLPPGALFDNPSLGAFCRVVTDFASTLQGR
jgi:acyl carrier protein